MDCNEVLQQLADYLDEDARADLCREIEKHLRHCHNCQLEVDTLNKTIMLFQADGRKSVEVPIRATQRLSAALAREYTRDREPAKAD